MVALIKSPTTHQTAIFEHVQTGAKNLIVQAVAGSGKTSTIIHAMSLLASDEEAIYLVFNKRNQLEAEERLRGTAVRAMTFNALGMRALGRGFTLEKNKASQVWREAERDCLITEEESRMYMGFATRLVDLARSFGVGAIVEDTFDAWMGLCNEHDLMLRDKDADMSKGIALARDLLGEMMIWARRDRVIDFADQLYLPVHPNFRRMCRLPRPDRIFVDETQDLSPVQVELVAAMMGAGVGEKPDTEQRVVFVGDRWQAIYGWRGAACDAMDKIAERFACDELPLSVCWRCGTSIVALAANLGAPIESAPGKSTGEVVENEAGKALHARDGQVVLCRTTAPLVTSAYRLIAQGRRAVVRGREIGQGLISLVKKMGVHENADIDLAMAKVDAWLVKEVARHVDREDRQEAARDKVECLHVLADMLPETKRQVADMFTTIEQIFSDEQLAGGITLSTIHKSKGLEWDEVTILDWAKMPAQWARREWQRKQELHCAYVAVTRARQRLVLCDAQDFEPKGMK